MNNNQIEEILSKAEKAEKLSAIEKAALKQLLNDFAEGKAGGLTPEQQAKLASLQNVYLEGTSLVIPEQEQLQPVATIDGVDYYHKQEFDLEEMLADDSTLDVLQDVIDGSARASYPYLLHSTFGNVGNNIVFTVGTGMSVYPLWLIGTPRVTVYTSHAYTIVDTQEEVTDNSKICLPTCSAYYGFLSEDRKTFISYYNLKTDGAPTKVDSVKQGNAVISIQDARIPTSTVGADGGKVIKVNNLGNAYELGDLEGTAIKSTGANPGTVLTSDGSGNANWLASSGGIKLYRHAMSFSITFEPGGTTTLTCSFVSTSNVNATTVTGPTASSYRDSFVVFSNLVTPGGRESLVFARLGITYEEGVQVVGINLMSMNADVTVSPSASKVLTDTITEI